MVTRVAVTLSVFLMGNAAWAESHAENTPEPDGLADAMAEEVDLEVAERIFQRNCRACHGNKAQGAASYPGLADLPPEYIVEMLKTYRAGERVGPNSVLMIQSAKGLTDAEIASLAEYVTTAFE